MDIQYVISDVIRPRITINKDRITLKNIKIDKELVNEMSEIAKSEYNEYMENNYGRTIRGRFNDNLSISWDKKYYPIYKKNGANNAKLS